MESLKIEIPEGYEINHFNKKTGEVTFIHVKSGALIEQVFLNIFDGCIIRFDVENFPGSIFYFDKKGNFLARYDSNTHVFWTTSTILDISFRSRIDILVDKHLKLKDLEEVNLLYSTFCQQFEQHFKSKPNSQ